jgi:excinuclease ABC subunit C
MHNIDLKELPSKPGVYTFINNKGKIIYVGKAKSLRKRIQSYFVNNNHTEQKKIAMLREADDLKFIVTKNEVEALLLEANLIKNEKPKYNVMLKDSKGYPYIKLTNEAFPKLEYTRNTKDNSSTYFGPFIDAHGVKELLIDLQKIFPLRSCNENRFKQKKICLKYQIKECCAPCESKITKEEYSTIVKQVKEFFKGNIQEVKNEFLNKMKLYAADLQFEKAAQTRDKLNTLDSIFTRQAVIYKGKNNSIDGFIFHNFKGATGLTQIFIRAGKMIGVKTFFFNTLIDNDFMITTILQFYNNSRQFPDVIIYYSDNDDLNIALLSEALNKLSGKNINIEKKNTKNKDIIDFALNNAEAQTSLYINKISKDRKTLEQLMQLIHMAIEPKIIECIDISHISGSFTVGISIAYTNGNYNRNLYRKYKIKSATNDDFKAIYEVMHRKAEKIKKKLEEPADLYIIDGGRGQLNAAARAFNDVNIQSSKFISIAKGRSKHYKFAIDEGYSKEEIFIYGRKNKLTLRKNDPVLLFVQQLRDEAHRFAISYSRHLLLKNVETSPLKNIKGVGPKRLKRIFENFSDIHINKNINENDLIVKCHIPESVAKKIIAYLYNNDKIN